MSADISLKNESIEQMYAQVIHQAESILHSEQLPLGGKYARLFNTLLFIRVGYLQRVLIKKLGSQVQSGPFQDMIFHERSTEGCYIPKLLGCYEAELHPIITELRSVPYQKIIDVGCAEGYYAVGLACVFAESQVWAFDINPKAQQFTKELAVKNGVSDRVSISGELKKEQWPELLEERSLIVCDIEGAEYDLLTTLDSSVFRSADLIVELHHINRDSHRVKELLDSFKGTHDIRLVWHGGRNPNQYPELRHWKHIDQWLAVWEFRGMPTPWAIMRSKSA